MSDYYIAQDWLDAVRNTSFYYPCAGSDYEEPITVFQDYVNRFCFCDLYNDGLSPPSVSPLSAEWHCVSKEISGEPNARMERRHDDNGHKYRYLEPSKCEEIYNRADGRQITVIWRRGFGQIGLSKEFSDRSLGVFMHRGDSPGEAGSNVYYLANRSARYEPCAKLFKKIGRRLRDKSIIITDGSNTSIRMLRHFHRDGNHRKRIKGSEAFKYFQGQDFRYGGFHWTCVGWLSRRYGPTLAWGLTREQSSTGCEV